MRRNGANFGNNRLLLVVPYLDAGVVVGRAFGVNDELCPDAAWRFVLRDAQRSAVVIGFDVVDAALVDKLSVSEARVERGSQIAVAQDVAKSRRFIVFGFNQGAPEAAAL